jgi:prepilin-type processing-associated H-X9-DG protein
MAHCDEGLQKIGLALAAWQREHDGKNPTKLEDLIGTKGLTVWDLVCPAAPYSVDECSYVYRGGDLDHNAPKEMIIAYDKAPVHKNRRNVLFADCHVERFPDFVLDKFLLRDEEIRRSLKKTDAIES